MPGLQDLCEKYFGCRDLYDVLKIPKTADEKQVCKGYRKLSLLVHPDRVEENKKIEATEKFKVLGKVHSILSDKEKRSIYDETGVFDEENDTFDTDWSQYWSFVFKTITIDDINNYEKKYKDSEEELDDLKQSYLRGKGNMDFILESVPFTKPEEEPRLRVALQKLIDEGEVPEFRAFTHETPKKKERRRKKWEKEAQEAAEMKEELGLAGGDDRNGDASLTALIRRRQEDRSCQLDSFFDKLAEKYASPKTKSSAKNSSGSKKKVTPGKRKRTQ